MNTTIQRDGRTWSVDKNGISNLKRKYTLILDSNNLCANGELSAFQSVPAIGSSHPTYDYLSVLSYDVTEGQDSEKKLIDVVVNYGKADGGAEESEISGGGGAVEEWGWEAGTD